MVQKMRGSFELCLACMYSNACRYLGRENMWQQMGRMNHEELKCFFYQYVRHMQLAAELEEYKNDPYR